MKRTIVVYGSSTGTCEAIANKIGTALGAEVIDVQDMKASTIAAADNLILGTSTWGAGEVQDDWYDGIKVYSKPSVRNRLRCKCVIPSESCLLTSGVIDMTYFG